MSYLVEGYAEVSRWTIEGETLVLEAWPATGVDLPSGPEPVICVELRGCVLPEDIRDSLHSLAEDGLWSVSRSESPIGLLVEFEAEGGWKLTIPCRDATVIRRPLSASDYEKAFAHLRSTWQSTETNRHAIQQHLEKVRSFVARGIERARRILDEASPAMREARLKAQARLDALQEVQKCLEGKDDA